MEQKQYKQHGPAHARPPAARRAAARRSSSRSQPSPPRHSHTPPPTPGHAQQFRGCATLGRQPSLASSRWGRAGTYQCGSRAAPPWRRPCLRCRAPAAPARCACHARPLRVRACAPWAVRPQLRGDFRDSIQTPRFGKKTRKRKQARRKKKEGRRSNKMEPCQVSLLTCRQTKNGGLDENSLQRKTKLLGIEGEDFVQVLD